MNQDEISDYIKDFLKNLERQKGEIRTEWLRNALFKVPRHLFIEQYYAPPEHKQRVEVDPENPLDEHLELIYSDRGLPIRMPPNHSAATQPLLVIAMLEALDVQPGMSVLEIGTGSGWNAGLLAAGVGDDRLVHSIDLQADLVEAARRHLQAAGFHKTNLRAGDGGYGWPEKAPFDRIIVTVGSPDIPPAWDEQLAERGTLLVPFKIGGVGDPLLRLRKHDGRLEGAFVGGSSFNTLQGAFWNNTESLESPSDPSIRSVLEEGPTEWSLVGPISTAFLLFVRFKERPLKTLQGMGEGVRFTVFDPDQGSIVVFRNKDLRRMEVYGDKQVAERLVALHQEWIERGRPKLTDYRVELVAPDTTCSVDEEWIEERPHATLRISLN